MFQMKAAIPVEICPLRFCRSLQIHCHLTLRGRPFSEPRLIRQRTHELNTNPRDRAFCGLNAVRRTSAYIKLADATRRHFRRSPLRNILNGFCVLCRAECNSYGGYPMETRFSRIPAVLIAGALVAACAAVSGQGTGTTANGGGYGSNPTLPKPRSTLIPTINIAVAKGWPGGRDAKTGQRAESQRLCGRLRPSTLAVRDAKWRRAG